MNTMRNFARHKSGATALEFALISPLFFLVIFSTFEVGRALYERNRISAAAAIASRALALDTAMSDDEIKAAIKAKLANYADNDLTITLTDQTFGGQAFKEIEISYDFSLLFNIGHGLTNFTLSATRFAPLVASAASSSSGSSSGGSSSGSSGSGSSSSCKGKSGKCN